MDQLREKECMIIWKVENWGGIYPGKNGARTMTLMFGTENKIWALK